MSPQMTTWSFFADHRAVQNDRSHPDQDFVVDLAGVHDRAVTNGDELAEPSFIWRIDMHHGVVLNVRAWANDDAVNIAAQHSAVPNTGFFFESDVANDRRARNDPSCGMNSGTFF